MIPVPADRPNPTSPGDFDEEALRGIGDSLKALCTSPAGDGPPPQPRRLSAHLRRAPLKASQLAGVGRDPRLRPPGNDQENDGDGTGGKHTAGRPQRHGGSYHLPAADRRIQPAP